MPEADASVEVSVGYQKKNILNIYRLETDTLEFCKPKIIRKRHWMFGEKVMRIHYRGNDDYTVEDI